MPPHFWLDAVGSSGQAHLDPELLQNVQEALPATRVQPPKKNLDNTPDKEKDMAHGSKFVVIAHDAGILNTITSMLDT